MREREREVKERKEEGEVEFSDFGLHIFGYCQRPNAHIDTLVYKLHFSRFVWSLPIFTWHYGESVSINLIFDTVMSVFKQIKHTGNIIYLRFSYFYDNLLYLLNICNALHTS